MIKKIVLAILLVVVVFHIGWYAVSHKVQNEKLPDEASVQAAFEKLLADEKIMIDRNSFTETFIEANGVKLHLDVFTVGESAPTVVFIPGTSVYAKFYIELMYKLYRHGFNVVGFDPRGHGLSSGLRGDYTIQEIVEDTLAVVKYARERFGGKVAVAGSSQGGIVAFYAAALDDSLAAAVCHNLADLNGRDNLILSQLRPPVFMVPLAGFLAGLYQSYSVPVFLYLDLTKEHSKNGTDAKTLIKSNPVTVKWITIRALGSLLQTDLARPVEKITVPVMIVHSENDSIFPRNYVEDIFNRLTCRKEYLYFEDKEHLVMTNDVDEVVPPIAAWLKKIM
jgi:alpha-beta hydrolase superfamily lysophospholipase